MSEMSRDYTDFLRVTMDRMEEFDKEKQEDIKKWLAGEIDENPLEREWNLIGSPSPILAWLMDDDEIRYDLPPAKGIKQNPMWKYFP